MSDLEAGNDYFEDIELLVELQNGLQRSKALTRSVAQYSQPQIHVKGLMIQAHSPKLISDAFKINSGPARENIPPVHQEHWLESHLSSLSAHSAPWGWHPL
jgi:hypothetical protein